MTDETNGAFAGGDTGAVVPEKTEAPAESVKDVADQAESSDASSDAETADDAEPEKPKKPSGSAKLRARLDREIAEKAILSERLRVLESGAAGQPKAATESPPREEDFNGDYFAFLKAQAVFEARQSMRGELEQIKTQAERERIARAEQESNASYANRVSEFRKSVADFDDVMAEAEDVPVSAAMADVIRSSDKGPALAYWLAKNPETATSIANMPPLLAARELGRIEAGISQAKPRTESKAPAPIKPVSGRAQIQKSPDEMSMEEYMAYRRGKT